MCFRLQCAIIIATLYLGTMGNGTQCHSSEMSVASIIARTGEKREGINLFIAALRGPSSTVSPCRGGALSVIG